jgi:ornithine carbamoyltransferase
MKYNSDGLLQEGPIQDLLMSIKNKSLLDIRDYSSAQKLAVIQKTVENNKLGNRLDFADSLKGKTLVPLFDKQSTRTYASTVAAFQKMGGSIINIDNTKMQIANGEPIKDTARTLGSYADILVARISSQDDLKEYNKHFKDRNRFPLPVLSGMTDFQHPLQFLTDAVTAQEIFGSLRGLKLLYTGDWNNVARSTLLGFSSLGVNVSIAAPNFKTVDNDTLQSVSMYNSRYHTSTQLTDKPLEVIRNSDIIMTDVWKSMGQIKSNDDLNSIYMPYQVNDQLLRLAKPKHIVMHCMPMHRGEELTDAVADRFYDSVILKQAYNRMTVMQTLFQAILK